MEEAKQNISNPHSDSESPHLSIVGTWILELKNSDLFWSDQAFNIHKVPIGTSITFEDSINFYIEEDTNKIQKIIQEAIEFGKSWDVVLRLRKDKKCLVRAVGKCIKAENRVERLEGTFTELNSEANSVANVFEITRVNQELNEILNKTSIVSRADINGKITYVNNLFCEISGYENIELIGKDHRIVNSGFHKKEFFKNMWDTLLSGNSWSGEIRNKSKSDEFYWVSTFISPTFNKTGKINGFVSIRRDITNEKKLSAISSRMTNLANVGESSTQIIHDVMNFLMIIEGNTRIIKQAVEMEMDVDRILSCHNKILKSCDNIKAVFKETKEMIDGGQDFNPHGIVDILKNSIDNFELLIEQFSIEIVFDPKQEYTFICNRTQLQRVFNNLLKNSIDAISALDEKWIKVSIHSYQDNLSITFTDSGKGISKKNQTKMFESFFTTKGVDKGTGLGLSSCRKIIESHGGTITYNSNAINTQFVVAFAIKY
jgi:PAS domain S-box-containing protein